MKAIAAAEFLMIIGMLAIVATMFSQVPKEVENLSELLTLSSADAVAKDIAGLIVTSASAPESITITYNLPEETSYTIAIKNNYVTVTAISEDKTETASAKIPVDISKEDMKDVKTLEITKTVEDGQNRHEVTKLG